MFGQQQVTRRQAEIVDLVRANGFVPVERLATQFAVTAQTIRREINHLCKLGLLRRTHGGVEQPVVNGNAHYSARRILNLPAKRAIANIVAGLVPDGASLAFSIGTTSEIVMQALGGHAGLRVFTNNLNVAYAATDMTGCEVSIAGGRLRPGDRDVLGAAAEEFFASYKVDFGILGVAGIEDDGTVLDFSEDEAGVRQAIIANCRHPILVLDHSKIGRSAHVRGGHLRQAHTIVSDRPLPDTLQALLAGSSTVMLSPISEAPCPQ